MSAKNTLANKAVRRTERQENADRQTKRRELQARMIELNLSPSEAIQVGDFILGETESEETGIEESNESEGTV
jgi:hypothetical protein